MAILVDEGKGIRFDLGRWAGISYNSGMTPIVTMLLICGVGISQIDADLSAYVALRRPIMDDASRPMAEREAIGIEVASALDRAAWNEPDPAKRRQIWAEARGLLDGFTSRNLQHPRARLFAFQGAVYLGAEGESWSRQVERDTADGNARSRAAACYEAASSRLQPLRDREAEFGNDALAQNIRFRLAQSLFDRSKLLASRPASPRIREDALEVLTAGPITEKNLIGYVELLRAEILAACGRFDDAHEAIESASRAEIAPPLADRLRTLVPIAAGRKRLNEARAALESATLDPAQKERLRLKIRIAERTSLPPGPDRDEAEAEAFRLVASLRTLSEPEAKLALMELARALDVPGPHLGPEAWSLLAEGAARLGQIERAAGLDETSAARSEARGDTKQAQVSRFRAASAWFRAGRFAKADAMLATLVDDPEAGMLRALAKGRGLAIGEPGITKASYESALADQIAKFPDHPTTGEARWRLGRVRLESGRRDDAAQIWNAIPRSHLRWFDGQLVLARMRRQDLEEQILVKPASELTPPREDARSRLATLVAEARDDAERADAELERILLELIPRIGDPREAMESVDRLRRLPLREEQRSRVDVLRIVAMVANDLDLAEISLDVADRKALAWDLDGLAEAEVSDRRSRRIGETIRKLVDPEHAFPEADPEAKLLRSRARFRCGDVAASRAILDAWPDAETVFASRIDLQRRVADLLWQTGDAPRAVRAFQSLARLETSGSPRWFAARLGLAKSLLAAGNRDAARKLVEGTTLLHPDLGGSGMKAKFAAIRIKIDNS